MADPALVQKQRHQSSGEAHSGQAKRDCGRSQPSTQTSRHRVDSSAVSSRSHLQAQSASDVGSLRDVSQQETSGLRLTTSGSISHGDGRSFHQLGSPSGVCVPSNSLVDTCLKEGARLGELPVSSGGPRVGQSELVSNVAPSVSRSANSVTISVQPSVASCRQSVPCESGAVQPSRLEGIQQHLEGGGFSQEVANRIASSQRQSSRRIYDSRWQMFVSWCDKRKTDPFNPSLPIITDFLLHLFKQGKEVNTIRGFRTALASTLKPMQKWDSGWHGVLHDLISNLANERPPRLKPLQIRTLA